MKKILLLTMFLTTSLFAQSSSSNLSVSATILPVIKGRSNVFCHLEGDTAYLEMVYDITFANTSGLISFEIYSQIEQEQYFLNNQVIQIGRMYEFGQVVYRGVKQFSKTLVVKNAPENFCAYRNIRLSID